MIAIIRIPMRALPSMPALLFANIPLHRRNIVTIVASVVLLTKIKKSHAFTLCSVPPSRTSF